VSLYWVSLYWVSLYWLSFSSCNYTECHYTECRSAIFNDSLNHFRERFHKKLPTKLARLPLKLFFFQVSAMKGKKKLDPCQSRVTLVLQGRFLVVQGVQVSSRPDRCKIQLGKLPIFCQIGTQPGRLTGLYSHHFVFFVTQDLAQSAEMFDTGKPFQPSILYHSSPLGPLISYESYQLLWICPQVGQVPSWFRC